MNGNQQLKGGFRVNPAFRLFQGLKVGGGTVAVIAAVIGVIILGFLALGAYLAVVYFVADKIISILSLSQDYLWAIRIGVFVGLGALLNAMFSK